MTKQQAKREVCVEVAEFLVSAEWKEHLASTRTGHQRSPEDIARLDEALTSVIVELYRRGLRKSRAEGVRQ